MSSVHKLGAKDHEVISREMLPPPSRSSNIARRGGHSSGGRNSHVKPTPSAGAARAPTSPQATTAASPGGSNQAQQHRPPPANMITASQEQKGISHERLDSQPDSDRTLSGQLLESDLHNETTAGPDESRAAPDIAIRAGRSETPVEVYERYRQQAERAERERDREDPDFELNSQGAQSPSFNGTIESQELDFLRQSTPSSLVDRTRRTARARQSDGLSQAQSPNGADHHQNNTPHHARRGSGPLQQELNDSTEDHSMVGLLRADASAAATPSSYRAKQPFGSAARVSPMMPDDGVKTPHRSKGRRTRNPTYEKSRPENRRERDEHIAAIKANWRDPPLFWPYELTPLGEKQIPNGRGGTTMTKEALEPKDVSTLLLKAIRRFSEATKGNYGAAMKLIAKVVDRRLQNSQEHKILLRADAEEATMLALSKAKAPGRGADAGPSARKRRAQQAADDESDPR
ncbi:hypothetical protein Tdes44962_MAKER00816 [Teratosphaeria destructans]|uniref:Uncharacterized protein n=1 Tax=Teratosphaeria destructans TaxID=418781 RepID=A0A9W7SKJ9_9PEZI|nr:hypothetical protein Tdes44962_MAKER00816 [Teratosphaeria destructans]